MKKLIRFLCAFIIITLMGCAGDSEGHEGEAKTLGLPSKLMPLYYLPFLVKVL